MAIPGFHTWRNCSDCLAHPNTPITPRVMLDLGVSNIPNIGSVPYGDPVIAIASYDFWVHYGSPAVGEVVHIHIIDNDGNPRDICLEFMGVTSTQQDDHNFYLPQHNPQYIGTLPNCTDCCDSLPPPPPPVPSVCDDCAITYKSNRDSDGLTVPRLKIVASTSDTPTALSYAGQGTNMNDWTAGLGGYTVYGEHAKFNDKIWCSAKDIGTGAFAIVEFTLNSNCDELILSRVMPATVTGYSPSVIEGVIPWTYKDSNILVGAVAFLPFPYTYSIVEIDISGPVAIATELFPIAAGLAADLLYLPQADQLITCMGSGIRLLDYSTGTTLDTHNVVGANFYGLWCQQGKIFAQNHSTSEAYELNISAGVISVVNSIPTFDTEWGDAGSNPFPNNCTINPYPEDKECYKIGDITDPADGMGGAGGMVFATPNSGWNNTPFYYEVALEDLHTGGTPIQNHIDHNPNLGGTMSSGHGESDCGIAASGTPGFTLGFSPSLDSVNTQLPNNQVRYGYGPGSPIDPLNTTPNPAWGGSIYPLPQHFPANVPVVGLDQFQHPIFPPGTTLISVDIIPMGTSGQNVGQLVATLPYDTYLLTFSQSMPLGTNQIVKTITFGGVIPAQPFTPTGAEWGDYGGTYIDQFSIWWDTGQDNTHSIVTHPAQPVFPSHEIAARVASSYNPPGTGGDRWFLPSLMEFDEMFRNVGLDPVHALTLNLSTPTSPDMMDYTYWTSSDLTVGNSNIPANVGLIGPNFVGAVDPGNHYAWAYVTGDSPLGGSPPIPLGPTIAKRCSSFSVRPIRRFECTEVLPPPPPLPEEEFYNFRDSTVTWTTMNNQANTWNIGYKGPFVGLWTPGAAGSWKQYFWNNPTVPFEAYPHNQAWGIETLIGRNYMYIRLATRDVNGNHLTADPFWSDAFNPNGYTITVWNNKKEFLGKWHYQNVDPFGQGYNADHPDGAKFNRLNPHVDNGGPGTPPAWYNDVDFPDYYSVKFSNVTHLEGDHETVIFGDNETLSSGFASLNSTNLHMDWYDHPYMDNGFNHWSGSYAYIKIESETINALRNPFASMTNGNNTAIDDVNVVCAKIPLYDSLNYFVASGQQQSNIGSYGNRHQRAAGFIGVGGANSYNLTATNTTPPGGTVGLQSPPAVYSPANMGFSQASNPLPPPDYTGIANGVGANNPMWKQWALDNGPFHYIFEWMADFQPSSTGLAWQPDFMTAWNNRDTCWDGSPYQPPCLYNVGDFGPAGGIICAVPYMNIDDPSNGIVGPVVAPLNGTEFIENPTPYYFELSPQNLNYTACSEQSANHRYEWGSADIYTQTYMDLNTIAAYGSFWVPEQAYYPGYTFPAYLVNHLPGEGYGNSNDMFGAYIGNPVSSASITAGGCCFTANPEQSTNAFMECANYNLNGYDDWFLPSTQEMNFARNYTAPGTLYDSNNVHTAGCGSPSMAGDNSYYWTSNALKQDDTEAALLIDNVNLSTFNSPNDVQTLWGSYDWMIQNIVNKDVTAFCVSKDPINGTSGPDGLGWRTLQFRWQNLNVRAMRRFTCADIPPDPCLSTPDCTCVDYNYRHGPYITPISGPEYGGFIGSFQMLGSTDSTTSPWIPNTIGTSELALMLPNRDVKGNDWTVTDWSDDSQAYDITLWDMNYNFLGKWRYNNLAYGGITTVALPGGLSATWNTNSIVDCTVLHLSGMNHIQMGAGGTICDIMNNAFVPPGSLVSHTFMKIEAACNDSMASAFETACNATIWGNEEFPETQLFDLPEIPRVCDNDALVIDHCILTWGTHQHTSLLGSNIWVFPDLADCDTTCGLVSIANSSLAKLAQPKLHYTFDPSSIKMNEEQKQLMEKWIQEDQEIKERKEARIKKEEQKQKEQKEQKEQVEPKIISTPSTLPPPTTTDYTSSDNNGNASGGGY